MAGHPRTLWVPPLRASRPPRAPRAPAPGAATPRLAPPAPSAAPNRLRPLPPGLRASRPQQPAATQTALHAQFAAPRVLCARLPVSPVEARRGGGMCAPCIVSRSDINSRSDIFLPVCMCVHPTLTSSLLQRSAGYYLRLCSIGASSSSPLSSQRFSHTMPSSHCQPSSALEQRGGAARRSSAEESSAEESIQRHRLIPTVSLTSTGLNRQAPWLPPARYKRFRYGVFNVRRQGASVRRLEAEACPPPPPSLFRAEFLLDLLRGLCRMLARHAACEHCAAVLCAGQCLA